MEELAAEKKLSDAEYLLHRRFDRIARLVGEPAMVKLRQSRVVVMGLGGVGSFAAESLARSGVGQLSLVDFDRVCVTNVNRQLHALKGNFGKPKAELIAERVRLINPDVVAEGIEEFYREETSQRLLDGQVDYVVDAIDQITAKCYLINACHQRGIPVVSSMGAGARLDPTQIKVADLNLTHHDPLAAEVRKILRQKYDFSSGKEPWGIDAVFSDEPIRLPQPLTYDQGAGFRCVCPHGSNEFLTCDKRARIDGTASFVTGGFGLAAASVVVRGLIEA